MRIILLPSEECPVELTLQLIGNKWKFLIISDLLEKTQRFGELKKSLAPISQKVLTQNLRELEKDGLIIRKVYPEVPLRVDYRLSELGETLAPVLATMHEWGEYYKIEKKLKTNDLHV